jgi:hypothetical protein
MIRGVRSPLAVVASALAAATLAGGADAIRLPAPPNLPAGWSHATVNVVIRRVPHTFTYDHGRVVAVSSTSLTLREPDGSIVTIAVDPNTRVKIAGRLATIDQVRRLEMATTVTVDGGAAALVQVRIPPAVARAIARGGR